MREDLLGYIVGALEEAEYTEIKNRLDSDPELRERLIRVENILKPLALDREPASPPQGLATRTLSRLETATSGVSQLAEESRVELASQHRPSTESLAYESGGWTFSDFVVAAGVCLAAACLFFPAILNGRYNQRLTQCQNNMRQLGTRLHQYSDENNGYFPTIPANGKLAFAGSYVAMLQEKGLISQEHANLFDCPSKGDTFVVRIAAIKDIHNAKEPRLLEIRRNIGGDYAYSLGFIKNKKLNGIRRRYHTRGQDSLGQSRNVVLADAPVGNANRGVHDRGQNVLFADGHAAFLETRLRPGSRNDNIYQNDQGLVRPGLHEQDAVLAPSAVPLVFVSH